MVWWVPYLNKGCKPDFNSGPGNDSNIGCILALQCLFESNLNHNPSQAIPILRQIEYKSVQIPGYGFLVGAVSAQGLQAWLQ